MLLFRIPAVRSGKYRWKIVLTYLSVMVVPLIFLNTAIYILLRNHTTASARGYNEQTTSRILNSFDSELYRMSHVAADIGKSLLIRKSSLESSPVNIIEAQKILASYTAANQFFSDILYYPRDELVFYGSSSVYSIKTLQNFYFNNLNQVNHQLFKSINAVGEPAFFSWDRFNPKDSNRFLTYVVPLKKNTDRDALVIFVIPIENIFQKILNEKESDENPLLLMDPGGNIVFSNTAGLDAAAFVLQENLPVSIEGVHERGHRGRYLINARKSKETDYTVIRMVPLRFLRETVLTALALILGLSFGVLMFELIVIHFALKVTYVPIRELAESFNKGKGAAPITDALTYLEKKVDFLRSSSESALRHLKILDFFTSLYDSRDADEDMIRKKALSVGLGGGNCWMAAAVINVSRSDRRVCDPEIYQAYLEHLTRGMAPECSGVCRYEPVINSFFCIFEAEITNPAGIKEHMETLLEELEEELMIRGRVEWSRFRKGFGSLKESLQEVLTRREQKAINHQMADKLKRYIDEQMLNPEFSVARTAEHFGMARSSVSTLFRRQCGITLSRYVGSLRVEEAKNLLSRGFSVNEVTLRVGYHDTTSFIRKFKRLTGMTPGEYAESLTRSAAAN